MPAPITGKYKSASLEGCFFVNLTVFKRGKLGEKITWSKSESQRTFMSSFINGSSFGNWSMYMPRASMSWQDMFMFCRSFRVSFIRAQLGDNCDRSRRKFANKKQQKKKTKNQRPNCYVDNSNIIKFCRLLMESIHLTRTRFVLHFTAKRRGFPK